MFVGMDKFLIRKSKPSESSSTGESLNQLAPKCPNTSTIDKESEPSLKQRRIETNLEELSADPGLRKVIYDKGISPKEQDRKRRAYLQKGPCQPCMGKDDYPQTLFNNKYRRFNPKWFDMYPNWLEYSVKKDAAFCLCCYLFKGQHEQYGGDAFIVEGFRNWAHATAKLKAHVGGPNSSHNLAVEKCENLLRQDQHIDSVILKTSQLARVQYRTRLNASIDSIRYLLRQGLAFRGHDESCNSRNRGNFLELLQVLAKNCEEIEKVVLQNAPENQKMTSPDIQKDIVCAAATETRNAIVNDIKNEYFAILVDESRDVSTKEQMAVVLRYVDKKGHVIERFLEILHVYDTSATTLKQAIDAMFATHGLSISKLRGQGYDGASNMRGQFNGLRALILNENKSAFYVHCFAHQLQLALVAVAKNNSKIDVVFTVVANICNIVGASAKRRDILREAQANEILKGLESGELSTGRGLNQEMGLKRAGDTRWSSHYYAMLNLIVLYTPVIVALESIEKTSCAEKRGEAVMILQMMRTFEFAFSIHLMKIVLGITNELSLALQRKDQDIVNAMDLVKITKQRFQQMRDDGWDSFLELVSSFCVKHDIEVPNMDDMFIPTGRSRRNAQNFTNMYHYRCDLFYAVIDLQVQELNNRFTEANTELLLCVACLNPSNSFAAFNKEKLLRLAEFYPNDFSTTEIMALDDQLDTFIHDMRSKSEFLELKGIAGLALKMVEMKKDVVYHFVYKLVKFALILPVATANVERVFSAMNIVKSKLRNRMGDQWTNDCLVTYIESDVFDTISNDVIMERFQNMSKRRGSL